MSKTHRRQHQTFGTAADRAGHLGPARHPVADVGAALASSWLPARQAGGDQAGRPPTDSELRIDLQALFDEEPDGPNDAGVELWQLLGVNPDELCIGDDGLVRLTVV